MVIENFNPQEFGTNLAQQAQQVVPQDLTKEQQEYVVNKVYQFCILAGNALNQDPNLNINGDQASIITQFIGEWTFHKSVDIIRAGLAADTWDQILQDIAFAVFETAKYAIVNNLSQDQIVAIIEKEVIASYEKSLRELVKANKITEEAISEVLSYSNIDKMAQEVQDNNVPEMSKEEEEKTLKFASIAILLKSLPEIKREKILSSMGQKEVDQIRSFMQIPDLESKVDPNLVSEFLKDFKRNMPSIKHYVYSQSNNIMSLKERFTEIEIKKVVQSERKKIRDYVDYCLVDLPTAYMSVELSPQISDIIANYVRSKLLIA